MTQKKKNKRVCKESQVVKYRTRKTAGGVGVGHTSDLGNDNEIMEADWGWGQYSQMPPPHMLPLPTTVLAAVLQQRRW